LREGCIPTVLASCAEASGAPRPNNLSEIFEGAPMTLRDISVDENRGGFCAANEGGVSRRE
jgi:hypothetical protein